MAKSKNGKSKAAREASTYRHPEADSPLRPEVGTQPQFKKRKPPVTYRYDSSLSPELNWDGQNHARETGEALIREILEAKSLEGAKRSGAIVSYDLNYRPSLWSSFGGKAKAQEVNRALKDGANGELRGILQFSEEPLVSSDFKGNQYSSIVDAEYTKVLNGNLIKILSWYDNEWGYSCRVRDLIKFIAGKGI